MKVLFAVNDENISTSIVKKYQKQYKEIISYKNVYYFNAILKELQRNKTYDRIVISEDLEEFTSSSYAQKDKFIFDRLDNISDEAVKQTGEDIPIILICSERRTKSEDILIKLFGIGIYNAIMGDDRSIDEVCRLIYKPRSKKEAKIYYKIDSENVSYEKSNDSDVSEIEMQNILMHFKKLGKNEAKYAESFKNIVSQYNDAQLKVIIAILPENVKSVLEENSIEYQKIVYPNGKNKSIEKSRKGKSNSKTNKSTKQGTSEKLLDSDENKMKLTRPVVVPTTMEENLYKKVTPKKKIEADIEEIEDEPINLEEEVVEKTKKRGRPRKNPIVEETIEVEKTPKKRGRPRKNPLPIEDQLPEEQSILPGLGEEFFNDDDNDYDYFNDENDSDDDITLYNSQQLEKEHNTEQEYSKKYDNFFDNIHFNNLLSEDKKIVTFVGTNKNGTSFIVNNIAQILSSLGINTAIFDATQNKNSYYIYTKNDEELRKIAINSLDNLINGEAKGIKVNNNLTVYTNLPADNEKINNSRPIMETLVQNHSAILIDCDFNTPVEYFKQSQEIYLVQSMDVLTIQPLTAFLKDLKTENILEENKIRIILNKMLKIRGVTGRSIIGGMSNYNDPEMSYMTELFDRNLVKEAPQIPFDEDVYAKYLEGLIECEIKVNGYPKEFKQKLNSLAKYIYPMIIENKNNYKKNKKKSNEKYTNSFSSDMNNTLNNMRKKY